jgi:hypothetical protein
MESYSVNFYFYFLLHIYYYLFIYLFNSYLTKVSVAHTILRPTDKRLGNMGKQVSE